MLEARSITKRYGDLTVLSDIDMTVSKGEIVAVTGPSGAGKTTLLQILGTLDRPDSGKVLYDGKEVSGLGDKALSRFRNLNIGFVFQFHLLLPEFTVLENVAMPALIAGQRRRDAEASARRLIDYLGLSDRASHRPSQLSGGERQRAAVARALVNEPSIVFADEPTGSLDSANRNDLQKLFFNLRRDFGHTFVIVTHDPSLAISADRTINLRDGRIVTDTPAQ